MSQPAVSDWLRQAMESEDGECISAGARLVHLRAKGIYTIDLSGIPPAEHEAVLAELREVIRQKRVHTNGQTPNLVD
jgi:hypothetical protein